MDITGIPKEHIDLAWPRVYPILKRAIARSGKRMTEASTLAELKSGDMQLWAIGDNESERLVTVGCTKIIQYPEIRSCCLVLCAGDHMEAWLETLDVVKDWAKGLGCEFFEVHGRPGWEKVLGFQKEAVILRQEL